jgi:5'-AMP-activated protein kinase regulatory gamma subunit
MKYTGPKRELEGFEDQRLDEWRNVLEDVKELVYIHPDASLFDAAALLVENRIHRLPVLDPVNGNVLYILTQKPILRFLYHHIPNLPDAHYFSDSIMELKIGSYDNIEIATEDTTIIVALHTFINKRISALPIVDSKGVLVDIYSKFDVINLAAEKTYSNLDVSLRSANEKRAEFFDGVHTCKGSESVFAVLERIVKADVHRLVVVDNEERVCGIVTVSDIINYIVLRHRDTHFNGNGNNSSSNNSKKLGSTSPPKWFHT